MDALWQFSSPIVSAVLTAILTKVVSETQVPRYRQLVAYSIIIAVFVTAILLVISNMIGQWQLKPQEVDIVASSTQRTVFTKQVDGQSFIGVTYRIDGKNYSPEDYAHVRIEFNVGSSDSDYFLVVGKYTDNYLLLERGSPNSRVAYQAKDGVEEFDVPLELFDPNITFDQVHIMTPYQQLENGETLSFSIQKLILLPKR